MRGWFVLALFVLSVSATAGPQALNSDSKWAELASREVATYRKATQTPGVALGLIVDDRIVFRGGFGQRKAGAADPVTAQTLFHMASVTKPFVSTGILQLVDAGKVQLSAPLLRYLPDFHMDDPRLSRVTIEQVLAHISGLPDVEDYRWDRPEYDDGALQRYLRTWSNAHLLFEPGERFAYSNLGYELLAAVIERVSGQPFERYMQAHVLAPLGMNSSTLLLREAPETGLARPHEIDSGGVVHESRIFPYNRAHAGSSTLYSNIDDMLQWVWFNVDDGTLEGMRLLSPEVFALQRRPHAPLNEPRLPAGIAAGLGLLLFEQNGQQVIGHSGSDDGFVSIALFMPTRHVGVVAMGNLLNDEAQPQMWAMALRILDAVAAEPAH